MQVCSILFSKAHFQHSSYIERDHKKISIPKKDLDKIKRISIIVGALTLGLGGIAVYYIWTASRKVSLYKHLEKPMICDDKPENQPVKPVNAAEKAKEIAKETLFPDVEIKSIEKELRNDPGHLDELRNLPYEQIVANLRAAPPQSYCFYILEENNEKLTLKFFVKSSDNVVEPFKFILNSQGLMFQGNFLAAKEYESEIMRNFYTNFCDFELLKGLYITTWKALLEQTKANIPLTKIDHNLHIEYKPKYDIEELTKQVKNHPNFRERWYLDRPIEGPKGSYIITPISKEFDESERPNFYRIYIQVEGSPYNSGAVFCITSQGFMYHTTCWDEDGEQSFLNSPNIPPKESLEDLIKVFIK